MRALVLVGVAAMVLDGCAPTVSATRLLSAPPQPTDHEILLFAARVPSCPFDELGLISVEPGYVDKGEQSLLDALKRQARVMGGDGIVGLTHGRNSAEGPYGTNTWTVLSGTAIRFTDPDCRK